MAIEQLESDKFLVRGALEKEAGEERDLDTQAEGYSKAIEDIEKEIANDTEIMSEMHADYISAVTMLMEMTVDDVATVKQDIAPLTTTPPTSSPLFATDPFKGFLD